MNAIVSASVLSRRDGEVNQFVDGSAELVVSTQLVCNYDRTQSALWSTWKPRGVPSFSEQLLRDLELGSHMIQRYFEDAKDRPLKYSVLRSGARGAFNVGGDLGLFQHAIASKNHDLLARYARSAVSVIHRNYSAHGLKGVTSIALLEGDALGGGLECALSCDVVIAERHVKAGFPEVLFNMFPGMGGISFLTRRVGRKTTDQLVRTGRLFSAEELLALGVIDEIAESGEGVRAVERLLRRREHQYAAHTAMNAVDRLLHPVTAEELGEVVKMWVESAMSLDPRSLDWMKRLYQRQVAVYGESDVSDASRVSLSPIAA